MPRSDWYSRNAHWIAVVVLLAVAVPLGAIVLRESAYNRAYKDAQATYGTAESNEKLYRRCLQAGTPKEVFDCLKNEVKPSRETQRAEEDLQAQRDMADWALGMLIATVLLGVATVTVTLVGVVFVRETLNETRNATGIAQQTLVASQRPWLSVTPRIASPLTIKDGAGRISIEFNLKNFGLSPALNVQVNYKILPLPDEHLQALNEITGAAKKRRPNKAFGHKIFPRDVFTYSATIPIEKSDIEAAQEKFEHPDEMYIFPILVGCAIYRSPVDEEIHTTEFMAHIGIHDSGNPKGILGVKVIEGEIPLNELKLALSFGSGSAD